MKLDYYLLYLQPFKKNCNIGYIVDKEKICGSISPNTFPSPEKQFKTKRKITFLLIFKSCNAWAKALHILHT